VPLAWQAGRTGQDWIEPEGRAANFRRHREWRPSVFNVFHSDCGDALQLLAPHMRQAFVLHSRLRRCEGSEAGLASALDQLETAMFLLDGSGRLQRTNAAGDRLLSAGDCLSLKGQRLCPQIAGGLCGVRAPGGAHLCNRRWTRSVSWRIHAVAPLRRASASLQADAILK
jgi:hypothetical protein